VSPLRSDPKLLDLRLGRGILGMRKARLDDSSDIKGSDCVDLYMAESAVACPWKVFEEREIGQSYIHTYICRSDGCNKTVEYPCPLSEYWTFTYTTY